MVISNLNDGLNVYSLQSETGTLLDEIKYNIEVETNIEVQCSFTNGGKWVVVGGTDGYIRIFERSSLQLLHSIACHGADSLVQSVSVGITFAVFLLHAYFLRRLMGPATAIL
jgi:hypothetical protein